MESTPPRSMYLTGFEDEDLDRRRIQKLAKLENELFDYQHNMGLLLIEKKGWASKFEEQRQALVEAKVILQREQVAHLMALSEVEKREENLRKALVHEKQRVIDLEKALNKMLSNNEEINSASDSKLTKANALVMNVEQKSLEVEAKLHAADAKFAELSRKNSEIERKMCDIEAKENALQRDRLSLNSERDAHKNGIYKEREELQEWEIKLKQEDDRLSELRKILNQREERTNENDRSFKQQQGELEVLQKQIDVANTSLKMKEDDISRRLVNLTIKEKEADALKNHLEMKEKELFATEEKLSVREKIEIQKLLDEHKVMLDTKKQEFELEIEQKRRAVHEELKNRAGEIEKREVEVNHLEEKIVKKEQALEQKLEKCKEKEIDFESMLKSLKEREKFVKDEERKLENEKKTILVDIEKVTNLKIEIKKLRDETTEQRSKISEERDQLTLTKEERSEHLCLQSELKQEIENCRFRRELLVKETEELKKEKEMFENEWEELDEKRVAVGKELEDLTCQKENFEKQKRLEEEKLKDEKCTSEEYVKKELETLKADKESFATTMENEKAALAEETQNELRKMLQEFKAKNIELEREMRKKWDDMENRQCVREKKFEAEKEKEMTNIVYLREVARREMDEMKLERSKLEKEKQETATKEKHLDGQRFEIQNDIDQLVGFSKKLNDQRQQLVKEREHFISLIEKQKNCTTCVKIASDLLAPDDVASPSGKTTSWLQKCSSKILEFSPIKKVELASPENLPGPDLSVDNVNGKAEENPKGRNQGKRSKPRMNRTHSVKAVVEEAKSILGDNAELNNNDEHREESVSLNESKPRNLRKRTLHTPQSTTSECHSESVSIDGRKRRRKTVEVADSLEGSQRYNLRRRKNNDAVKANEAVPSQKEIGHEISNSIAAVSHSISLAGSENGRSTQYLQFEAAATSKLVEKEILSDDEVDETPTETKAFDDDNDDDENDGEYEEDENEGEVTIGKKLWTFFTT
ncbi:nuclear matrix constituent protein 1-like [Impatiens glandulifera]|uniref:nuclear matrix constituent protein 1-like n=1 Tax=Impatiens glandulifera TaxID=253017 RepID=UPI001FB0B105|nr:nuclear matrix constituent protein 1-like [Impatiens glandulifera]